MSLDSLINQPVTRREFLVGILGFTFIANTLPLRHDFIQTPNPQKLMQERITEKQRQRQETIPTYGEWKAGSEKSEGNIKEYIILRQKIINILRDPEKAYNLLTDNEKELYNLELKMMDITDVNAINQKYGFKISLRDRSKGTSLLIFFERYYGYKRSDEKSKKT